jgi:hypothetical protein
LDEAATGGRAGAAGGGGAAAAAAAGLAWWTVAETALVEPTGNAAVSSTTAGRWAGFAVRRLPSMRPIGPTSSRMMLHEPKAIRRTWWLASTECRVALGGAGRAPAIENALGVDLDRE